METSTKKKTTKKKAAPKRKRMAAKRVTSTKPKASKPKASKPKASKPKASEPKKSKALKDVTSTSKVQRPTMLKIPLELVVVEEDFNVRKELGDIDALAESIAEVGQKHPATVAKIHGKKEYILTDGHRRYEAIKLANSKYDAGIKYLIAQKGETDRLSRTVTMMLSGNSKRLTDGEKFEGFNRLHKEFNMSVDDIVKMTGISQAGVYNTLQVNKAPEMVQDLLKEDLITIPAINEIQRTTKDPKKQIRLASKAIKDSFISPSKKKGKATPANVKKSRKSSPDVAKLEEALSIASSKSPKAAILKAVVNKLKSGASAKSIANLLK